MKLCFLVNVSPFSGFIKYHHFHTLPNWKKIILIKQAAIHYSASTVCELFHLESALAFCFEFKTMHVTDHVIMLFPLQRPNHVS